MMLRWLTSQTIRQALVVYKHYRNLLAAQRDLLPAEDVAAMGGKLEELRAAIHSGPKADAIAKADELQNSVSKWLKPYPNATTRENVEVLLVALSVAMGIRTFFLQPFKIPTSSMQPTLFGVTSKNYLEYGGNPDAPFPTGWERIKAWFEGTSYIDVVAENEGRIERIDPPVGIKLFNIWQNFQLGGKEYTIWFPPDCGEPPRAMNPLAYRAGIEVGGQSYKKGDHVIKLQVNAGDHLFVDRLSYNFRKPARGDIIVFETAGIPEEMRSRYGIPGDEFYIKRLVGLPGEKVSIGNDRHLRINGQRLDASTAHFESVYGFDATKPPRDSQWSGHLNGTTSQEYGIMPAMNLPFFPDENTVVDVAADGCLPMGDNTCVSLDSRFWGPIPERYVIGRSFFVYWPLTGRFGSNKH